MCCAHGTGVCVEGLTLCLRLLEAAGTAGKRGEKGEERKQLKKGGKGEKKETAGKGQIALLHPVILVHTYLFLDNMDVSARYNTNAGA